MDNLGYNAPIEGTLITVDLFDTCLLYTAISYELGPPSSNTIIINKGNLHVRNHLLIFSCHYREALVGPSIIEHHVVFNQHRFGHKEEFMIMRLSFNRGY